MSDGRKDNIGGVLSESVMGRTNLDVKKVSLEEAQTDMHRRAPANSPDELQVRDEDDKTHTEGDYEFAQQFNEHISDE